MAIWLFAIEIVALVLSAIAFWCALFGRIKSRAVYLTLAIVAWIWLSAGVCALAVLSWVQKYKVQSDGAYFAQASFTAVAVVIGGLVLVIRGARRSDDRLTASRWPVWRLLLLWIATGAIQWWTFYQLDQSAQSLRAQLRSRVDTDYFKMVGATPPDDENAQSLYELAFQQFDQELNVFDRKRRAKWRAALKAREDEPESKESDVDAGAGDEFLRTYDLLLAENAEHPDTPEFMARLEPAAQAVVRATERPYCRFHELPEAPDITVMDIPYSKMRTSAMVLQMRALQQARQGKLDEALLSIRAINRIARHVDQERASLVSGLVRLGMHAMACDTLMMILPDVKNSPVLPTDLLPDESGVMSEFERTIRGEECLILSTLLNFGKGDVKSQDKSRSSMPGAMFYRVFWLKMDTDAVQLYMAGHLDRLHGRPPVDAGHWKNGRFADGSMLVRILLPSVNRAIETNIQLIANLRQTQIGMALTQYRLKHGSYPATLDPLVPDYLSKIPEDPFDDKPMRYLPDGSDVVIYSVGPDKKDDKGVVEWDRRLRTGRDTGFRLRGK